MLIGDFMYKDKKIVFMGTPDFSVPVLKMLIDNRFTEIKYESIFNATEDTFKELNEINRLGLKINIDFLRQ